MNKKIILKLVLLLLINISNKIFSQSVSLTVNNVNGSGISSSQPISINANTTATVSLDTQVTLANAPSDNYPGTIKIYYQKNTSFPINVANGGDGGGLLFLGSTTAYRSFTITLNSGQFDATGGYIYAEYQTYSGIKYKSANRAVVVNTTTGGDGGTGNGGTGTSCALSELVPYGGTPLLPLLPADIPGSRETIWVLTNYGLPSWEPFSLGRSNKVYESANLRQEQTLYGFLNNTVSYSCGFQLTVYRPFLDIDRLYVTNDIESNQYITYGSNPQTISGNQANISSTNPEFISYPSNNYQWQKRVAKPAPLWDDYNNFKANYSWTDIPNATQQNYTPSELVTIGTEYRRLIIDINYPYSGRASVASNVIEIFPVSLTNISNTICCNQNVYSNQNVNTINGSTSTLQNVRYKWQLRNITYNSNSLWEDIDGAVEKDYSPLKPRLGRQSVNKHEIRRVIISDDLVYYFSNSIIINYYNTTSKMANNLHEKNISYEEITFYPNPVTTSLNIKNINSYSYVNLNITDLTGRLLYSNKLNNFEYNEFPIDISNLPKGIYNLIIDTNEKQINLKFVKE